MFKRATTFLILCLAFSGLVNLQNAQAQNNLSIGYVDPQAILSKMPEMKAVQQRLQNFADRKRQELQDKQASFQEQVTAYQQKSAVISEEAKQKEEQRLGQLQTELQQFQTQLQQEIQQKQQELVGPLLQQIEEAINTVAEERGLTYVLNTTTSNGDVIILYASPSAREQYDITDQVMQQLGI
ncbi:OmpH family outer membrane protein [Aliifodinibius sp. S!AR15-10]|uniref:OmpH family outer membrane protein n=1 Tax=Aliifodinibius sp. S!AR15-10 TaxID=2950437 RepID=UPI002865099F|nr:OmpH family outer membrane protein [Aliifodinibius sp. S!AR15-10]MDR8389786.1 OmpH family outer membrane protein [Aliifodinibius sp. S!AR15-10]